MKFQFPQIVAGQAIPMISSKARYRSESHPVQAEVIAKNNARQARRDAKRARDAIRSEAGQVIARHRLSFF